MSPFAEILSQAVEAARCGERQRALGLFKQCLEIDPGSVRAWLWVSELADQDTERLAAMEMALALLPPESELGQKITARASRLHASTQALPNGPQTMPFLEDAGARSAVIKGLERAEQLRKNGGAVEALEAIEALVNRFPESEQAWLALSESAENTLVKIHALEEALKINPANVETSFRLAALRAAEKDALARGSHLEAQGQAEQAIQVYLSVATHSRLPAERVEARRRIEDIRLRQEADTIHKVSPDVHLLRLTAGPVLLFGLMVFIQSGLNPLHIPLLALPGLVCVLAGSLIISATDMRPVHPRWVELVGVPGHGEEPEMRRWLRLLGFALMVAPFTMFLIEASYRLGILQSSMLSP